MAMAAGTLVLLAVAMVTAGHARSVARDRRTGVGMAQMGPYVRRPLPASAPAALRRLVAGGVEQTAYTDHYDASYRHIGYPNGDVPRATGVCADVIVRAFRKAGVDLQVKVHQDMSAHFGAYPHKWGLPGPDPNIDHRRVPNLATYFDRMGKSVRVTRDPRAYRPGDVVVWQTAPGREHTGLVTDYWSPETRRWVIVHNIGSGARLQDVLLDWKIIGHYRYF
jgi:uncharacterized protein YijF (DUF1287 family)